MDTRSRRFLAVVVALLVTVAISLSTGWAAPVPSQSSCRAPEQIDAKAIAAERELVKGKLMEFGLTDQQAASRVGLLTDQEVHALAKDLDSLQVGGVLGTDTTTLLLLLILVVLIAS